MLSLDHISKCQIEGWERIILWQAKQLSSPFSLFLTTLSCFSVLHTSHGNSIKSSNSLSSPFALPGHLPHSPYIHTTHSLYVHHWHTRTHIRSVHKFTCIKNYLLPLCVPGYVGNIPSCYVFSMCIHIHTHTHTHTHTRLHSVYKLWCGSYSRVYTG